MARIRLEICECSALKKHHHAGVGVCEAALMIPSHGGCDCRRYKKVSGRGNKHGARRTEVIDATLPGGSTVSDSGLEAERLRELLLLQRGKYITDLHYRCPVNVEPEGCEAIMWKVDFAYVESGAQVYEDAKSESTYGGEARIKAKLLRARYPEATFRISWRDRRSGKILVRDVTRVDGAMGRRAA